MKNIIFNRKHWFAICLFFLLTSNGLFAQKLSEKIGGIATNFTILSGKDTLDTEEQIIIKRGKFNSKTDYHDGSESGYGYGYGYESFHFEFISNEKISETQIYRIQKQSVWYCTFHCYDKDGKLILKKVMLPDRLKKGRGSSSYVYSINLVEIPIVTLDNTTTIRIEWLHYSRKHKQ